ncbi:MAG TPA: TfoX/Sxy family protein [Jatrophihabitans sp.]
MAYSKELADRIREAIAAEPAVREVSMFGGLSFLINGKLALTANQHGDLMLRCDPARVEELTRKGAEVAEMRGRRMSKGWLIVSSDALEAEEDFAFWLGVALEHNRSQHDLSRPVPE